PDATALCEGDVLCAGERFHWIAALANDQGQKTVPRLNRHLRRGQLVGRRGEHGLIAYRVQLTVEQPFRRRGLASALYSREGALFRALGVQEIHADAIDDGRIFLLKRTGFSPRDPAKLVSSY